MKDYKRLTETQNGFVIDNCANCPNINKPQGCTARKCNEIKKNRLAALEDKIESGEIEYVADKDKEIARLTAENDRLREEAAEQKSIAEHEHATQMEWFWIACDYKAKNDELKKRLDNAIELPCVQCVITLEWIGVEKRAWHCFKQWVVLYKDSCDQIVIEPCTSKDAAEARLAELKGGRE